MSASTRRTLGMIATIATLIVISSYCAWRIDVLSRRGWAGFSYVPPIGKAGTQTQVAGLQPGAVFMLYPSTPAERAGMQRGDLITTINGFRASNFEKLSAVAKSAKRGDVLHYVIQRDGRPMRIDVPLESPLRSPVFAASFLTSIVVSLTFLLIGAFVFWRRPLDPRATVFFAMTLIAAITFANTSLAQVDSANLRGISANQSAADISRFVGIGATGLFFAPLLLHLALIFPRKRPVVERRRRLFVWIYGYPTAFIVYGVLAVLLLVGVERHSKPVMLAVGVIVGLMALAAVVRLIVSTIRKGIREGVLEAPIAVITIVLSLYSGTLVLSGVSMSRTKSVMPLFLASLILVIASIATFGTYAVATFVALFRSYRESGLEERRQVKWPVWATMVAMGGKIILSILGFAVVFGTLNQGPGFRFLYGVPDIGSKLLYVLIPLSFAFAILKYRLMNIDVIIRRTVLYSMLTFVVFVLYGVLVASVGTALVKFAGMRSQAMLVASTVVIALAAVPIRNRLQKMVDRNLFREKRDAALALRNIGNAIGGSSVEDFMRYCCEQIQQTLQNRFVILAVRRDQEFVAAAKVGVADEVIGRVRGESALQKLGATLILPVRKVALLALGSKLSDEEFSADDREFLESAAAQIAIGLENVRLRVEEADFEQARAMQQILLPKTFPQLSGFEISGTWQPARSVGGDYFDTFALGANQAAICIGDVAGKGMPAALLMANLQAAVKATASQAVEPAMLCERIKQIVSGNLQGGKFISFFYGVLDAASHTFKYSNAGHNPPILVRAGGGVERLDRGGPAICRLFRDVPQEQDATELAPGDRIVLFTDGASEARRGEEDFGDDRLIEVILAHPHLGARELQERIMAALRDFTGGDFGDDVTLVVIAARQETR